MTVKKKAPPAREPKSPAPPTASQAWNKVLARMNDLGDAMAQWTKAAANEAGAKEKLDQVRASIGEMARSAETTLGDVESSEFGQQVRQGAEQAGQTFGEAAQRVRDATEPHVKSAFAELSDVFGEAAARMNEPRPAAPKSAPSAAKPKASAAKPKAPSKKK